MHPDQDTVDTQQAPVKASLRLPEGTDLLTRSPENSREGPHSALCRLGVVNVISVRPVPVGVRRGLTHCDPCAVSHCMTPSVLQEGASGLPVSGTKKDTGVDVPSHVAPGAVSSQAAGEAEAQWSRVPGRQ